jgi:transposase
VEVQKLLIKDVEVLDVKEKYKTGMSIADIARETGYCEKTIRRWIKAAESPRYKSRPKQPGKLDPYKDYIMSRLAEGVFNCEILLREIRTLGYAGGITILRDMVAPFRQQFRVQAVRRFETRPGEQMQVDWGYLGTFELDGQMRKVYVFILILGYSRFLTACCTTSMDLETLLLCHERCFSQAGGVARQIVYDNMKTVTLGRDTENKPIWQPRFIDFALYYGFKPVACTPYRPRSKGKVEASVRYIKENFCPGRRFSDLADLNNQLQHWLNTVANIRTHGTTRERPLDLLGRETLQQLPASPFPTAVRFPRQVSRDGFFSYEGVLYSVPWHLAGGQVEVQELAGGRLHVWWHGTIVAEHTMPRDNSHRIVDPKHMEGLPEAQRRNQASGLIQCYPEVQKRHLSVYEEFAGVAQ